MEQFRRSAAIRREDGDPGVGHQHGVHRRTVRQALASPIPPPRKPRTFPAPRLDASKAVIDAMCARTWMRPEAASYRAADPGPAGR